MSPKPAETDGSYRARIGAERHRDQTVVGFGGLPHLGQPVAQRPQARSEPVVIYDRAQTWSGLVHSRLPCSSFVRTSWWVHRLCTGSGENGRALAASCRSTSAEARLGTAIPGTRLSRSDDLRAVGGMYLRRPVRVTDFEHWHTFIEVAFDSLRIVRHSSDGPATGWQLHRGPLRSLPNPRTLATFGCHQAFAAQQGQCLPDGVPAHAVLLRQGRFARQRRSRRVLARVDPLPDQVRQLAIDGRVRAPIDGHGSQLC